MQKIWNDEYGIMIICAHLSQIQLLTTLESFEIDMCYKRIKNKDFKEVTFATFLPDQGKSK